MEKAIESMKRQQFKDFVTYYDIMLVGLAFMSPGALTTDPHCWHRAFFDICSKYRETIPELRNVFFDSGRPPLPPMSDQYYTFLSVMMMSGVFYGSRETNTEFIPEEGKKILIADNKQLIGKYGEDVFKGIAKIFQKHLNPKKGS